jgi:biopolymer transport protein ExbD
MITRPLDLESRLSPPPRDFNAVAWVNVGLIVLFFSLLGSRFVLAPGLLVELPVVEPASVALVPTSVVIGYRRDNVILFEGGMYTLAELRGHLERFARKYPGSVLQVNADQQVSTQALADLGAMAASVGFSRMLLAGNQPASDGLQK